VRKYALGKELRGRIYDSDYSQFCYELGVLLESWGANIHSRKNEIHIIFPQIQDYSTGGIVRNMEEHNEKCDTLSGHASSLTRRNEQ